MNEQVSTALNRLRAVEVVARGELAAAQQQRLSLYVPLGFAGATGPLVSDSQRNPREQIDRLTALVKSVVGSRLDLENWALNEPYYRSHPNDPNNEPFPEEPPEVKLYRETFLKILT